MRIRIRNTAHRMGERQILWYPQWLQVTIFLTAKVHTWPMCLSISTDSFREFLRSFREFLLSEQIHSAYSQYMYRFVPWFGGWGGKKFEYPILFTAGKGTTQKMGWWIEAILPKLNKNASAYSDVMEMTFEWEYLGEFLAFLYLFNKCAVRAISTIWRYVSKILCRDIARQCLDRRYILLLTRAVTCHLLSVQSLSPS